MTSRQFRQRFRAYGVLIPACEVESHMLCGWLLIDDCGEFVLMQPPRIAEWNEAA